MVWCPEYRPAVLVVLADRRSIDVGSDSFAVLCDGTKIDNPQQRKRGSKRRGKAAVVVAKAHRRIRKQRGNFHQEVSRWLVNRNGLMAVEDLLSAQVILLRARIGCSRLNAEDMVSCVPRSGRLSGDGVTTVTICYDAGAVRKIKFYRRRARTLPAH